MPFTNLGKEWFFWGSEFWPPSTIFPFLFSLMSSSNPQQASPNVVSAHKTAQPPQLNATITSPVPFNSQIDNASSSLPAEAAEVAVEVSPPFRLTMTTTTRIVSEIYNPTTSTYDANVRGHDISITSTSYHQRYVVKEQLSLDARDGLGGKHGVTSEQLKSKMLDALTCISSRTFGLKGGWPGIQSRLSLYEGHVNNGRYVTLRGNSSFPPHYNTSWKQQLITDSSGEKRKATATEGDFEALLGLWTDG